MTLALQISHHSNKFRGYRHCASDDVLVLACHVILQDRMIKGSCDFMSSSPLQPIKVSYHRAKFGSHNHSGIGVIRDLVCHVILQGHVVKGSCDFMGGSPSW